MMINGFNNLADMPIEDFKAHLAEIKRKAFYIKPVGMGEAKPIRVRKYKKRDDNYSSHRGYFK